MKEIKNVTKGFTLIELLVVVLIIGILAAVALPQYQKAVEKTKAAQALILLKALVQASQSYYLTNGIYPSNLEELDVDIPWTGNQKWHGDAEAKSNKEWTVQIYKNGTNFRLWVGRISGPYAGTGFSADSEGNLMCVEDAHENNHFTFSNSKGSYCEKIFQAIPLNDQDSTTRYYTLP